MSETKTSENTSTYHDVPATDSDATCAKCAGRLIRSYGGWTHCPAVRPVHIPKAIRRVDPFAGIPNAHDEQNARL